MGTYTHIGFSLNARNPYIWDMIQRLQTIFFGIALICILLMYFTPFAIYTPNLPERAQEAIPMEIKFEAQLTGVNFVVDSKPDSELTDQDKEDLVKDVEALNERIDKKINESKLGILFTLSMLWNIIVAGILFWVAFLFKKPKRQINVSIITSVLLLLYVTGLIIGSRFGLNVLLDQFAEMTKGDNTSWNVQNGFAVYLPIIAIVCIAFAIFRIKKDQKLIKSMDTIR
ncbi:MAG: hypothetical protein ACJASQ_001262 [Crocinitomicaceae bacterium]|jgi:hypothetical protein